MSKRKKKKPPVQTNFKVGDKVRVKHGIVDVEYPDMPLGGWAGTVSEIHKKQQKQGSRKRGPAWESADVPDDAYADGILAKRAIDDLRRLKGKDQPFFLAVGFFKPHLPFIAPQKYWDLYDHEDIHLPDNYHAPKDAPKESIHTSGELRFC